MSDLISILFVEAFFATETEVRCPNLRHSFQPLDDIKLWFVNVWHYPWIFTELYVSRWKKDVFVTGQFVASTQTIHWARSPTGSCNAALSLLVCGYLLSLIIIYTTQCIALILSRVLKWILRSAICPVSPPPPLISPSFEHPLVPLVSKVLTLPTSIFIPNMFEDVNGSMVQSYVDDMWNDFGILYPSHQCYI